MRPQRMSPEDLADFLRMIAEEVAKGASSEGSLAFSWPGLGEWMPEPTEEEVRAANERGDLFVRAAVRNGNDMGQGGMWLVGEIGEDVPPEVEHATAEPTADPIVVTEQRRSDIASRMVVDLGNKMPMLSDQAIEEIVEEVMFPVEHLLAEIEGLRSNP